jgi:hypothetical protein
MSRDHCHGASEVLSGDMAVHCGEAVASQVFKVYTPADDWESFFHVLSWVALRFTVHGLTSAKLTHELRNTYDDVILGRRQGLWRREQGEFY